MSFRLLKLDLSKHPVLKSLSLDFYNDEILGFQNEIYNTVIIGANGIGKSHILKSVIEIFTYIHSLISQAVQPNNLPYRFRIQYSIDNDIYTISSMPKGLEPVGRGARYVIYCDVNEKEIHPSECKLPNNVIASSMTISDKFRANSDDFYKYNGVRNEKSPSTTGTRTLIRKTVNNIITSISSKNGFRDELKNLLLKLGLQDRLTISYGMRHKEVFLNKDMSPELLYDIFDNRKKYFPSRDTDLWGKTFFLKVREQHDKIKVITDFLRKITINNLQRKRYILEYDIINSDEIIYDAEAIDLLSKLDILTFPSIRVHKNYENYNFMDSSSGETNLLCQFIGILSTIQDNSLIIIDEPENSSHPNWQINYIGWLKDIFKEYLSCHFVIATHSHFILTDLQEHNSTIIALEKADGRVKNIAENLNTFCWSVDDILYNVFHVRNTRNSVFENKMMRLYKLVTENNADKEDINRLLDELERYKLTDDDPLNKLIKLAKNKNAEVR